MGRKKFMLDGALRGRNELIQDSIYKDTRIKRDRKQVSSHLQVLKQHLKDQPGGKPPHALNYIYPSRSSRSLALSGGFVVARDFLTRGRG